MNVLHRFQSIATAGTVKSGGCVRRSAGRSIHALRLGLLALGLVSLSACAAVSDAQSAKTGKAKPPVPVKVAKVVQKDVPLEVRTTGTVQAYSTVSVKSQVAGLLTQVHFREGQDVQKGQSLFTIDTRPQQASVAQAEAQRSQNQAQVQQAIANYQKALADVEQAKATLLKDQVQAKNAESQLRRYQNLAQQGVISQNDLDQYQTTAEAQQATVKADQQAIVNAQAAVQAASANIQNARATVNASDAAIDNAQVQLSYGSIYSPIEGRASSLQVNEGNLVKDNDTTPLVVISQIRPIYVQFTIPQRLLPELNQYRSRGALAVEAISSTNPTDRSERGTLTFVDSGLNANTGTIQLKGTFPNADERLTPGEFVTVVLKMAVQPHVIVIPTAAIQTGQQGQFVYVVTADQSVQVRQIAAGNAIGSETVIKQGLKPSETIVVDGQFNLAPGAKIQVKS